MDNTRSFTAELSGITTSIGECRGDTIAFVRISQWKTSLYYTPGTQILPTSLQEIQPPCFVSLNGQYRSFCHESFRYYHDWPGDTTVLVHASQWLDTESQY
jgi:hypothetical protein